MEVSHGLVNKTMKFSLFVQLVTGLITVYGLFLKLKPKDQILTDILGLETIVQFIEAAFYVWIMFASVNINLMASRRYIDWVITTPVMLLSTIMFMKYDEVHSKKTEEEEKEKEPLNTKDFIMKNKEDILKMVGYNAAMLLFGYMGETNAISKYISIPIGFVFFFQSFHLIYEKFAQKTEKSMNLFKFLVGIWSLYGVAAMFPANLKNVSYNLLDIVSKNFYGLYIFYEIMQVQKSYR
jgi:bacteriorhodopsin